ncbi:hypothetical protein D9758_011377 [Tetrapyrgos nigripes]|uniref:Uncharacterized protein n=1 Tax=Tetrapyrgos nigripes TaxID=182062 RepID=A0A8H5G8H4_9AGAR|nr:hypothetical protein D9758_011377 [Tetrapyrgos nigripes]
MGTGIQTPASTRSFSHLRPHSFHIFSTPVGFTCTSSKVLLVATSTSTSSISPTIPVPVPMLVHVDSHSFFFPSTLGLFAFFSFYFTWASSFFYPASFPSLFPSQQLQLSNSSVNNSPTKSPFTPRLAFTFAQSQHGHGTGADEPLEWEWIKRVDLEEVRRFTEREHS